MKVDESDLAPPVRLAIAYARPDLRGAFSLLLRFDDRIAGIVGRSTEPMIAQMKIAWWYDAIAKAEDDRPKGEPLLIEVNEIGGYEVVGAMQSLLDAWGLLLAEDQWSAKTLDAFAQGRADGIFRTYARWVGDDTAVAELGKQWAIEDLRLRFGNRVDAGSAHAPQRLPMTRRLRPLTILALAVTSPTGFRMMWHALTGR